MTLGYILHLKMPILGMPFSGGPQAIAASKTRRPGELFSVDLV